MPKFNPPPSVNFSNPSEWPDWKQRFESYRITTKLHKDDEDIQVNSLIYAMGKEAKHIFKSLVWGRRRGNVWEGNGEIRWIFSPEDKRNTRSARFRERKQGVSESSEEAFIRALYELVEYCGFPDKNDQIHDQIVKLDWRTKMCQKNCSLLSYVKDDNEKL